MGMYTQVDERIEGGKPTKITTEREVKDWPTLAMTGLVAILDQSVKELETNRPIVDGPLADGMIDWFATDGSKPAVIKNGNRTVTLSYTE